MFLLRRFPRCFMTRAFAANMCPRLCCMLLEIVALRCAILLACAQDAPHWAGDLTTTRTSDETFRVEMTGAVGGKVLAFDVGIALHA